MGRHTVTIGIDIGTSGAKGIAAGRRAVRSSPARPPAIPCSTPRPGWTEQEPEAWWQATRRGAARARARPPREHEVAGIGLSGQMHGSVFLDAAGDPIRPALLWNDARTHAECDEIERRLGRERRDRDHRQPRQHRLPGAQAALAAGARARGGGRVAKLLLPKDFIRLRLTGEHATDAADASGTLFLDLRRRRYSDEILDGARRAGNLCRRCSRGRRSPAALTAAAAAADRSAGGTPVVAGGGDNACAAIGAGLIEEGHGVCSLGTSGTLFVHSMTPRDRPGRCAQRVLRRGARRLPSDGRDPGGRRFAGLVSRQGRRRRGRPAGGQWPRPVHRAPGPGGRCPGRRRGPAVPALPCRRAVAAHGPARARRLDRAQPRP